MTTDPMSARPPAWAEAVLRLLHHADHRDSVSGDLLEVYRDTIVPAVGSKADLWYVRQVAWYLLRASGPWGLLVGGALVIRYLFDTLMPVARAAEFTPRAAVLSYTLIAIYFVAASWHAWRTGHLRSGLLVAVAASVIGGVASSVGTLLMLAIWHDPEAWRMSGGLDEALLVVPLDMIPIAMVAGVAGGVCGKFLTLPFKRRSA